MNEHREVDIDLLADYIGGALDGAEAAVVARLIADDPLWRETHDLLVPATAEVGAALRTLGADPEPMPADIAARLEAALAAPTATEPAPAGPALGDRTQPEPEPVRDERHLHVVSGADTGRTARRRRLRWAAPIAAAAGVLAFVGIGLDRLIDDAGMISADSAGTQAGPAVESDASRAYVPPDDRIVATGTDYTRAGLGRKSEVTALGGPAGGTRNTQEESSKAPPVTAAAGDPLSRLRPRDGLSACLEAIAQQYGGAPIYVESVDYARFEGAPALIVRFVTEDATWVWAVGPDCGSPGFGPSSLGTLQVG